MLLIECRISENNVDYRLRLPLLERLQERGLTPLIRTTRLHCYETALLGPERAPLMEQSIAARTSTEDDSQYIRGDIFCFEDYVLFLIFNDEENTRENLRAGIVYETASMDARNELDGFCRSLSEALNSVRESESEFIPEAIEWETCAPPDHVGLESFSAVQMSDAAVNRAQEASIETSRAAEILEETNARRLLRRITEAHVDGRVADLLSGLKGKAETEVIIRRLAGSGLLRREVVISCRQVERPLFRLPSPDALDMITESHAICSECGANIADEKIEELVVPTDTAARLLEDGSWLSKRLRAVLLQLGLSEEQIINGPISADGEAYMIANVCREPFLFALKDGDVTATHARHALGKLIETEAVHLVVVATGKIQEEARTRLREHARRRLRSHHEVELLLIESVEAAASELQHAFERVSNRALAEELSTLNSSLGLSVGHMLATRFRLMKRSEILKDFASTGSRSAGKQV
jgi:hypothetical protein